jgi:predicted RNA binding protein YcfA (HicA-like mRNA interferase family)
MARQIRELRAREVLRALRSFGFEVVATRGSHAKLRRILPHGEKQTLTVPMHKTLSVGTVHAIFRQASRFLPESDLQPWFFHD